MVVYIIHFLRLAYISTRQHISACGSSRDEISRNGVRFARSKAEINIYPFFVLPKPSKVYLKLDRTFTKTITMAMFAYKATLADTPLRVEQRRSIWRLSTSTRSIIRPPVYSTDSADRLLG